MVPFHKVELTEDEIDAVLGVLNSGWLTSGPACSGLEDWLGAHMDGYAVALSSCTAALEIAMRLFDVQPGDEVITTSLTFVATSAAIAKAGGTPVWVDVNASTGLIEPDQIEAAITSRTVGILTVDYAGQRVDHSAIRTIADKYGLFFVSDAAHSLGSASGEASALGLADAACLSFYATKNLTGGEGGALVARDASLRDRARVLRLHGMSADAADRYRGGSPHYDVLELGEKANLSDINAALVLAQAARLDALESQRRQIAAQYTAAFSVRPELETPSYDASCVWHLYPLRVVSDLRDQLIGHISAAGVSTSVHFRPVHTFTYWRQMYPVPDDALPNTIQWGRSELSLPIYPSMTQGDVDQVIEAVGNALDRAQA